MKRFVEGTDRPNCDGGARVMWRNTWGFIGLSGAFLLGAVIIPPNWLWLSRLLLAAAAGFALLAFVSWSRRREP